MTICMMPDCLLIETRLLPEIDLFVIVRDRRSTVFHCTDTCIFKGGNRPLLQQLRLECSNSSLVQAFSNKKLGQ
jgi:hypothetical protein